MRGFRSCARVLVRSALVACAISVGAPCVAQEVDPPTPPDVGDDARGSLTSPSVWLMLSTPVQERIDLKIYGFFIGELNVPVAQVDLGVRAAKFLTITPSYMGYRVPASGLNKLTPEPGRFTEDYEEHQFRIDGTVAFAIRKFELSVRNMYVRRFRPDPADDINRYRGRIALAHPVAVGNRTWKPFAMYETFYEREGGGWNRDRIWSGVTLPVTKQLFLQPSYMFENSKGSRDIHYLLLGIIVNIR